MPSTGSPHWPRSRHPQAAETLLGDPRSHQPSPRGSGLLPALPRSPPGCSTSTPGLLHGWSPGTQRWGPQRHGSQDPSAHPGSSSGAERVWLDQHPCPPPKKPIEQLSQGQGLQRCACLTLWAPLAPQRSGMLPHSFAVGVQGMPGTGGAVGAQREPRASGCAHPDPSEPGSGVRALASRL